MLTKQDDEGGRWEGLRSWWPRYNHSSKISSIHIQQKVKKNGWEASQRSHGLSVFREYLSHLIDRLVNENSSQEYELTAQRRSLGPDSLPVLVRILVLPLSSCVTSGRLLLLALIFLPYLKWG